MVHKLSQQKWLIKGIVLYVKFEYDIINMRGDKLRPICDYFSENFLPDFLNSKMTVYDKAGDGDKKISIAYVIHTYYRRNNSG